MPLLCVEMLYLLILIIWLQAVIYSAEYIYSTTYIPPGDQKKIYRVNQYTYC